MQVTDLYVHDSISTVTTDAPSLRTDSGGIGLLRNLCILSSDSIFTSQALLSDHIAAMHVTLIALHAVRDISMVAGIALVTRAASNSTERNTLAETCMRKIISEEYCWTVDRCLSTKQGMFFCTVPRERRRQSPGCSDHMYLLQLVFVDLAVFQCGNFDPLLFPKRISFLAWRRTWCWTSLEYGRRSYE